MPIPAAATILASLVIFYYDFWTGVPDKKIPFYIGDTAWPTHILANGTAPENNGPRPRAGTVRFYLAATQ